MPGHVAAIALPGFTDPVMGAQSAFRTVLDALARPGRILAFPELPPAPSPLAPAAAAVLLTLADFDTPLWLDPAARIPAVTDWLRFHAGCVFTDKPAGAAFALATGAAAMPALSALAIGTDDYPDRSTTLVLQVADLSCEGGLRLTGPGIPGSATLSVEGLPQGFVAQWQANHALFPLGVDLLLVSGDRIAGLPRTTMIEEA
ncbi:MAG: phosphonate C-P lyase system protein PhnH [Pseudomonadota bacterium]|nr:phosphonate C-P lyase system protein PhnH [Pseudomonadota bacterium]